VLIVLTQVVLAMAFANVMTASVHPYAALIAALRNLGEGKIFGPDTLDDAPNDTKSFCRLGRGSWPTF